MSKTFPFPFLPLRRATTKVGCPLRAQGTSPSPAPLLFGDPLAPSTCAREPRQVPDQRGRYWDGFSVQGWSPLGGQGTSTPLPSLPFGDPRTPSTYPRETRQVPDQRGPDRDGFPVQEWSPESAPPSATWSVPRDTREEREASEPRGTGAARGPTVSARRLRRSEPFVSHGEGPRRATSRSKESRRKTATSLHRFLTLGQTLRTVKEFGHAGPLRLGRRPRARPPSFLVKKKTGERLRARSSPLLSALCGGSTQGVLYLLASFPRLK